MSWDYTTWLNIVFLILAGALIVRFARTGGLAMLRMMGGSPDGHEHHGMDAHVSELKLAIRRTTGWTMTGPAPCSSPSATRC